MYYLFSDTDDMGMADVTELQAGQATSSDESSDGKATRAGKGRSPMAMKRGKYVSVACEGCKRRKIKCNGETPCVRCGKLLLDCVYTRKRSPDSTEEKRSPELLKTKPNTFQQPADDTSTTQQPLRADSTGTLPNISNQEPLSNLANDSDPVQVQTFRFRGPTSSAFSLDLAKYALINTGLQGLQCHDELRILDTSTAMQLDKDALWYISKDEALRLIQVYEDECGSMYPIVDIETVREHTNIIYAFMDMTASKILDTNLANVKFSSHVDNDLLKIVLATALIIEGKGQSVIGRRLFEDVQEGERDVLWTRTSVIDVKRLRVIVIMAMYQFHRDEEHLAWRKLGQAARLCIEMGLHRRERLVKLFDSSPEYHWAVRLFWAIYVLDRRWSFGCGLNFAINESDVDPNLPEPDAAVPYLVNMVRYARISSWIWSSVCTYNIAPDEQYDVDFLEYQILKWRESLPADLQIYHYGVRNQSRKLRRLKAMLFLRFNQMRILIYRPVLRSQASIQEKFGCAQKAVEIAKETIRFLIHLDQTSDIYRGQEVCFNHFLFSALVVIFLAVSNAQAEFGGTCGKEFHMAVDLVQTLSVDSYVSKRLWESIKCLASIAPKLGLMVPETSSPVMMNPPIAPSVNQLDAYAQQSVVDDALAIPQTFQYQDFVQ